MHFFSLDYLLRIKITMYFILKLKLNKPSFVDKVKYKRILNEYFFLLRLYLLFIEEKTSYIKQKQGTCLWEYKLE